MERRMGNGTRDDGPPSTVNLYLVDEVLSALQKAVRRSLLDECVFWTAELARSGLGALAMARFGVMCSEDVSLGHPGLPEYVLGARRRYLAAQRAGDAARAHDVLIECAYTLGVVPKNRMPATAAVWVYAELEAQVDACAAALAGGAPAARAHWLLQPQTKRVALMVAALAECAAMAGGAGGAAQAAFHEAEGRAVALMQTVYLEDGAVYLWRALGNLRPRDSVVKANIAALRSLVAEHGCSAERYCLIHAAMLFARAGFYPREQMTALSAAPGAPSFRDAQARWPGRAFPIPSYALDKHTRRGGSGGDAPSGRVKGRDTRPLLLPSARYWNVDVSEWTAAEAARSHGDGVVRAAHTTGPEAAEGEEGLDTLLTHFYKAGVVCVPAEYVPGGAGWDAADPYRLPAQGFNLRLERRFHGKVPPGTAADAARAAYTSLREAAAAKPAGTIDAAAFPTLGAARPASPPAASAAPPAAAPAGRRSGKTGEKGKAKKGRLQGGYLGR